MSIDDLDHLDAGPFLATGDLPRGPAEVLTFAVTLAECCNGVVQWGLLGRRAFDGAVLEDVQGLNLAHATMCNVLVDLGDGVDDDNPVAGVRGALDVVSSSSGH